MLLAYQNRKTHRHDYQGCICKFLNEYTFILIYYSRINHQSTWKHGTIPWHEIRFLRGRRHVTEDVGPVRYFYSAFCLFFFFFFKAYYLSSPYHRKDTTTIWKQQGMHAFLSLWTVHFWQILSRTYHWIISALYSSTTLLEDGRFYHVPSPWDRRKGWHVERC